MNKSGVDGLSPYIVLGDGTEVSEVSLTRTSVPVNYFNIKVNVASSENANNALLQKRYNTYNPYKRPFVREDGYDTSIIKDSMEFVNCVVFIKESDTDVSTHREFADCEWHYYSMGNIGDSKKTDSSRTTDPADPYECCIEIMDVQKPLSDFPADTMMNAMGYSTDTTTGEKIYTWAKDENLGILYELVNGEYVLTTDTTVDLTKTYYVDILEHDDFSEDYTYGWRYLYDEDDEEAIKYCHQKWIEAYRFVTTSTDEEFKAGLGDYFVLDSILFYYLFTTRYTMIDNRAKNSFWHYGWTGEYDDDGNKIRKFDLAWCYDADSSLGINNYGDMVYRYGLEDTDVDENGVEVFRESDSTFFCRLRDLFPNELKALYNTLESSNAWHGESMINQFDEWQSEFPEELWRVDIERKYIRTYTSSFINGAGDAQYLNDMAHGRKKYQRREYERNQEKYMASKYQTSTALNDSAVLRCLVPDGDLAVEPNYRLKLTPYAYMYLNVQYGTGNNPIQVKGVPNVEVEIPFEGSSVDIINIYSSPSIKSFGDLSSCYARTISAEKASKLKELIIGNDTEGYDNPSLTSVTLGSNYLLEKLNIENVSGLTQSLELSALSNLRELYAHGSNVSGVTFADGGNIEIAELPAIGSMTMKNLIYLTTLDIVSFDKLTTLTVENCSTVDLVTILEAATNLNRVRLTGIDWTLEDTSLLERLREMKGLDKSGYNADQSVLTGKVHVPVIKQYQLYDYQEVWPELEISADTIKPQFPVTFMNADGTVLEVQYVIMGESAVDPTTREDNPITPTLESTVSHEYTFAGWDSSLTNVLSERIVTATYTESLRSYTIKYVSMGTTVYETTGLYGENVPYVGDDPVYTAQETGYVYYLFNRWDKSGFIDGDKTVTAIFDVANYASNSNMFVDRDLADLSPVEIYALTKLSSANTVDITTVITDGDDYSFTIGNDVTYDDIESQLLVSEKTYFDGSNNLDTGIQLFDEDKDFVLAIDYEFSDTNSTNGVLAQCYQENGDNGFKLWYSTNDGVNFNWGTVAENIVSANKREILIIRHKKGDNNLYIYKSNLDGDVVLTSTLEKSKTTTGTSTLIFGCAKADDGYYENYAIGNINWAKVWYADLGEDVCNDLAMWTHENITLEACGFRKYYLTENTSKRCSFSLLASHLLGRTKKWNSSSTNDGGWASSTLNASLNNRLYHAIPTQIKALLKQVIVKSNDGIQNGSVYYTEVTSSDCYITIPAAVEMDSSLTTEPYNSEGTAISYLNSNDSRKRAFDGGDYSSYWLRSPNASYANYVYYVDDNGQMQPISSATNERGVLIEISF